MKKLAASILTLAFLTVGVGAALGATDTAKLNEITGLYQQMFSIRTQIIDKQVEAGLLDKDQAKKIKSVMQERQKKMEEAIAKGELPKFGDKRGCGHRGANAQTTPPSSQ